MQNDQKIQDKWKNAFTVKQSTYLFVTKLVLLKTLNEYFPPKYTFNKKNLDINVLNFGINTILHKTH